MFIQLICHGMMALNYLVSWFRKDQRVHQQPPQATAADETTLQDLPIEVRVDIWEYLSARDHKALRQQCKQFKHEIDQITGVQANLTGPTPGSSSWLKLKSIRVNPEVKRVQENLNWVTNCVVRGLTLNQLSGLTFEPNQLISNPHILHRLQVEIGDDLTPKTKVIGILNTCNNLRVLDILCRCNVRNYPETGETCRNEVNAFTQEVLQSLVTKPHMKELSISAHLGNQFQYRFAVEAFPLMQDIIEIEPPRIKYPSTIQILKIEVPILKNSDDDHNKLISWKTFIDQQKTLVELHLNLGFVHWTYFLNVIQHNERTLKKLTLYLSNWEILRTTENWNHWVPANQQLNWTELLLNSTNLTYLKVVMSTDDLLPLEFAPHLTRNFINLNLNSLTTLELRSVFLDPSDFHKIFALPRLTNVNLKHWSILGQASAQLAEIARTTFRPVLLALLTRTQLLKIDMLDVCVTKCPKYMRKVIEDLPNYTTTWPSLGFDIFFQIAAGVIRGRILVLQELSIIRKPEDELIPPMFDAV